MRTLRKITIALISLLMIYTLSIGAYAEARTRNEFSFSFQDCVYTPFVMKTDDVGYATVRCTAIRGSDTVKVTICDSNRRPVSNTIAISGISDVKNLTYTRLGYKGDYYCLRICPDNFASVAGYWTP